jgi:hypothetical protein
MKEASTLAATGYEVEVLGAFTDAGLKARDELLVKNACFRFTPGADFTQGGFGQWLSRAKPKTGRTLHRLTGIENVWQLGSTAATLKRIVNQSNADLFIAHSESAMWAVSQLSTPKVFASRRLNSQIGIDLEDWYSEDLLPQARRSRPIRLLRALERKLLRDGSYKTCTSRAMAEALAREYGCDPPVVIYNAFPWTDRQMIDGLIKDRIDPKKLSVHWYSQTLGRGRGLEDLIAALPLLEQDAEIHLRGKPTSGFKDWLLAQLPAKWSDLVFIHDVVGHEELLSRIAEHDIGFAGEQKYCRSRDLTVTNKILHYLLGGLAVVASDTAGQREVAQQAQGAVQIYQMGDPTDLAANLDLLLSSAMELTKAKEAALAAAEDTFCWEKQAPTLVRSVEQALARRPA